MMMRYETAPIECVCVSFSLAPTLHAFSHGCFNGYGSLFSHVTAALIHGWPWIVRVDERVHVLDPAAPVIQHRVGVIRHPGTPRHDPSDAAFDAGWHASASDPSAATQLLDDACRSALREAVKVGWYRATYDKGAIEVRVDAESLAGRHLLAGMDVVAAFARSEIRTTAYR